jgi:hypothetical protein
LVVGSVVVPDPLVEPPEQPAIMAPTRATVSTTAPYLTHFDLTEISLLRTGDVLSLTFYPLSAESGGKTSQMVGRLANLIEDARGGASIGTPRECGVDRRACRPGSW